MTKNIIITKHSILIFGIFISTQCMEISTIIKNPQCADAPSMQHQRDTLAANNFLHFLHKNRITIKDQTILNINCSTGALSAKLAEEALYVYGSDSNASSIDFAWDKYRYLNNLSFEHNEYYNFILPNTIRLGIVNLINDMNSNKQMLRCINNNLPINGELFATITTQNNTIHPALKTAICMVRDFQEEVPYLTRNNIIQLLTPNYPYLKDIHALLHNTGFKIIKSVEQITYQHLTRDQLINTYSHIILNNPAYQTITNPFAKITCATQYINNYIEQIPMKNDKYLEPIITTVIHAQKVKKITS